MELSAGQAITIEENTRALLVTLGIELNEDARNQLMADILEAIEWASRQPALGLRVQVTAGLHANCTGTIVGVNESLFSRFHVQLDDSAGLHANTRIRLASHELKVIE